MTQGRFGAPFHVDAMTFCITQD